MKVLIYGDGNSAHIIAPMLAAAGHEVSLYTLGAPSRWSQEVAAEYWNERHEKAFTVTGRLAMVSNQPGMLVPRAEVIILCMPVNQYRPALHEIARYLRPEQQVWLGTIYGQGGFNWMVEEVQRKYSLPNLKYFAFGLIPWIARIGEYGRLGITYGGKARNCVALHPGRDFALLKQEIFDNISLRWFGTGEAQQSPDFISLTLSVDNQIIHPTRCYALAQVSGGQWDSAESVPYFYRDYDQLSVEYLQRLDDDYTRIRQELRRRFPAKAFPFMLDYLALERFSYASSNADILSTFVNSKTLREIRTPVVQLPNGKWGFDIRHRFFSDDIYYGICIAKWFAQQLDLETPMADEVLHWVEGLRGEKLLDEQKRLQTASPALAAPFVSGLPEYYGKRDLAALLD